MRCFTSLLLPACMASAQLSGPALGEPQTRWVRELLDDFPRAEVRNSADARVNPLARAEVQVMPALALHPPAAGDAVVGFAGVAVPACPDGLRALLLVHLGLSDGIPWADSRQPNGVRFSVVVQGQVLLQETLAETGWFARVADLTPWAGQAVTIELRTNAVDGNAAFDWALFGRPRLVTFLSAGTAKGVEPDAAGLALIEVRTESAAVVTATVGAGRTRARLGSGSHILPVLFRSWAPAALQSEPPGSATLVSTHSAPWAYAAQSLGLTTDSGFATAGRPFSVVLALRNPSDGCLPSGRDLCLRVCRADGSQVPGLAAEFRTATPALAPADEGAACWPGLVVTEAGDLDVAVALGDHQETATLRVYPPEPTLPAERPRRTEVRVATGAQRWALVANPWCRLAVVLAPAGDGYGLAEVWNGTAWERTGSLFPLLRVVAGTDDPTAGRERLGLVFSSLRERGGALVLSGSALSASGLRWPLRLTLAAEAKAPRIRVRAELEAPTQGGRLLAFAAPTLLPGDRAYGVDKDFALFPGLEYLEGPEPSSSPRDLAPPLHDRRVPAPWKIACPVMAVQGREALAALAWDPHQEWLSGKRLPAARFVCPAPEAGLQYQHLSLFVPGVADGTPENSDEGAAPIGLAAGQTARLACWLVLDHVSHYPAASVVRGPHRGGLVTQAVRHWFDLFGLPEPSSQPRSWSAQRALSREAYLGTLWQDTPPGWSLTIGEAARPHSSLAAPLLLDLRAGLPTAVDSALRQRVQRVLARCRSEEGLIVPVHGNSPLLQYQVGDVPEALQAYVGNARGLLSARREGIWVWQPHDREHAPLGIPGAHTLGQAAYPCLVAVRAALYSGDPELGRAAVEALRQTEQYELPRGASMWECPQFQPDIFAAALAIKAYCAAYRLCADPVHLEQARYWAWTGLGFVYTWTLDGYPTMLYNTVGVKGSTFFTHSWIGRPVVWMGLDYAYALQDLAEFDTSFDWRRVAAGIAAAAMWQQYTEGPSRGCYPDSWEQATNRPNPVDINPILVQLNAFRLRGQSIEVRTVRLAGPEGPVSFCAGADIRALRGSPAEGRLSYRLQGLDGWPAYASLAQVQRPTTVAGAGDSSADSAELGQRQRGWLYDETTCALVVKHGPEGGSRRVTVRW